MRRGESKVHTERSQSGFTLIELLVTITIVAILSLIGLVAYANVQQNARDSKRKADIQAIAKALESNYTSSGYPALSATMFSTGAIPRDPQEPDKVYTGQPAITVSTWTICATLEKQTGNTSKDLLGQCIITSVGGTSSGGCYCLKSSQ